MDGILNVAAAQRPIMIHTDITYNIQCDRKRTERCEKSKMPQCEKTCS